MKINIEINDSYIGIEGITSKKKKNTHSNGVDSYFQMTSWFSRL